MRDRCSNDQVTYLLDLDALVVLMSPVSGKE